MQEALPIPAHIRAHETKRPAIDDESDSIGLHKRRARTAAAAAPMRDRKQNRRARNQSGHGEQKCFSGHENQFSGTDFSR